MKFVRMKIKTTKSFREMRVVCGLATRSVALKTTSPVEL